MVSKAASSSTKVAAYPTLKKLKVRYVF